MTEGSDYQLRWHNKPKRTLAKQDARDATLGRSLVIMIDPDWEARLEMNYSEGMPFTYPGLLMGSIAYLWHMIDKDARITQGVTYQMLGRDMMRPCPYIEADLIPDRLHSG